MCIHQNEHIDLLTLFPEIINGIEIEQFNFTLYQKPTKSKIDLINFDSLTEDLRSKFFVAIKKFYTSSLKDMISLINQVKPSNDLKVDAIEKALQYRVNNYYGGYYNHNFYGNQEQENSQENSKEQKMLRYFIDQEINPQF